VKKFLWPPNKGAPAKYFYIKSGSIIRGCRVPLALSERVYLYNGVKMILSMKTKMFAMQLGPRPPTGNSYQLPHPLVSIVDPYVNGGVL